MSRSVPIVIALIFGILIGIGIGLLLQSDSESDAANLVDSTKLESSHPPEFAATGTGVPVVGEKLGTQSDGPEAESTALATDSQRITDVTRDEVASESVPAGDGVIHGRVTDSSDQPIAEVVVLAVMRGSPSEDGAAGPSPRGFAAPKPRSLEDELAATREAYRRQRMLRFEAMTNELGEYRIEGLRPARYELSAWADGFVVESQTGADATEPGRRFDFTATPALDVSVIVRHPDGSLAQRASLSIDHDARDTEYVESWSAENPRIRLARGRYRVHAFARWMRDGLDQPPIDTISAKATLDLTTGMTPAPIELTLAQRIGIRGRVVFGDSMRASYVYVKLAALPAGQEINLGVLRRTDTEEWVHSDDPAFAFHDLKPGRYVLGVMLDVESPLLATRVVEVVDRVVEVDLEVRTEESFRTVLATVYGPGNELVSNIDFEFRVQRSDDPDHDSDDLTRMEAGRGRYAVVLEDRIAVHLDHPEPDSQVHLIAVSPNFGRRSVPIDASTRAVEIHFPDPAYLEVQLLGYGTIGCESRLTLDLEAQGTENRGGWGRSAELQADGSSQIGPIAPGEYQLEIALRRHSGWGTRALFKHRFVAAPGVNRITLPVPQLHSLTLMVPGISEGRIYLESSLGDDEEAPIENGRAQLSELPAATYSIWCEDENGERRAEIVIPEQTTVTLPAPPAPPAEPEGDGEDG